MKPENRSVLISKESKDANKLIEEFMLLANRTVAEFVGKVPKGKTKRKRLSTVSTICPIRINWRILPPLSAASVIR